MTDSIIATTPEKGCKWHSIPRDKNDNGVGPSEPMSENFRKTPYASLVREAIQNSLDVVKDFSSMPVEIRFSIGHIDSKNFPEFFKIRKNIEGCIANFPNNEKARKIYPPMLEYIDKVNRPNGRLSFIRISDHNTTGMHYDNPENNDAPFYAFVRSAGVSSKTDESSGGSFGFGKAAYFYLSALRTILVSTKTEQGKYYFEGVSSLCSHKVDGQTVSNIVYYDNNGGQPTTNYNLVPGRFQRKDKNGVEYGSGTDIFIMGINFDNLDAKEDIYDQMFKSVLENFWLAILQNKLVVKIGNYAEERIIDSSNIATLMTRNFDEHDSCVRKNYNPRPYFDAVNLAESSEKFIHREINLNKIERLTGITRRDWGHVHFYFQKNKKANNRIVYMRSLRMKVSITPGKNGEGYYGVIVCPDGECNTILRSMEDPSHSSWSPKRLDNKRERNIAKILLEVIEEEKDKVIREIFNLDEIETVKIKGLEQYLYLTSETDEDDDEDAVTSMVGSQTGKIIDDGFAPTTVASDLRTGVISSSESLLGKVLIQSSGDTSPNPKGEVLTGRGSTKIKNKHTSNHISAAKPARRNSKEEGGDDSYSLEPVQVSYRTFAQKNSEGIIHRLIIRAPHEIENGRIDLLVGGESSDSIINLVSVSPKGIAQGNSVIGLHLLSGVNRLELKFADNLQHSIKLDAYEVK